MASIDAEITGYLPLLGKEEKKSILGVIKSFLNLKGETPQRISIEDYNKEINKAIEDARAGRGITQEEFEKEAAKW